ncbi:hypothetical protein E4U31_006757, partial [Claviceps sp. LM219 group G6]
MYTATCDDNSRDRSYAVHDFLTYPEPSSWLPGSDLNAIQHMQGDLIASGFNELCYQDL